MPSMTEQMTEQCEESESEPRTLKDGDQITVWAIANKKGQVGLITTNWSKVLEVHNPDDTGGNLLESGSGIFEIVGQVINKPADRNLPPINPHRKDYAKATLSRLGITEVIVSSYSRSVRDTVDFRPAPAIWPVIFRAVVNREPAGVPVILIDHLRRDL